jgi:hypothetical protein
MAHRPSKSTKMLSDLAVGKTLTVLSTDEELEDEDEYQDD